jgi:hypothetical protein
MPADALLFGDFSQVVLDHHVILRALKRFALAGHSFVPGSTFECSDAELAHALIARRLAERVGRAVR